ncbi:MAG: hypothetical protein IPM48_05030 [Saprospiraceae bacterium]|nr:hypothetical protein [Saprospiraceae bacterium]
MKIQLILALFLSQAFFIKGIELSTLPHTSNWVYQSNDFGDHWQDISNGLPTDIQINCIHAKDHTLIVAHQDEIYKTSTALSSPAWKKELGLKMPVFNLVSGKNGLYAVCYNHGIYQSIPGTGIWTKKFPRLETQTIYTILESKSGHLFVTGDKGIFKSSDQGNSWSLVYNKGLILDIFEANGAIIAGGRNGVIRSKNGGEDWEELLNENTLIKHTSKIENGLVAILGAKDVSSLNPEGITSRIRLSMDGGRSWSRMDKSLKTNCKPLIFEKDLSQSKDLYEMVQAGQYLFCSFDLGIFRSSDLGKSWQLVLPADEGYIFQLAVSENRIFAARIKFNGC